MRAEILPGSTGFPATWARRSFDARADGELEFVTLTRFESLFSVRAFAGADYERAVVPEAARTLLARFDERSAHYETLVDAL